jgi:hypothetical protein
VQRDTGAGAVVRGAGTGGGRVAVRTGAAADVAGVMGAAGAKDAEGAARPHAEARQATSRQLTATADFTPTLRGCRERPYPGAS